MAAAAVIYCSIINHKEFLVQIFTQWDFFTLTKQALEKYRQGTGSLAISQKQKGRDLRFYTIFINPSWALSDYPSWAAEPRRGNGALISHSPLSLISDFSTKPIVFLP